MGRPSTPIISRKVVAALALKLIDQEGIEALTMRRLAKEESDSARPDKLECIFKAAGRYVGCVA